MRKDAREAVVNEKLLFWTFPQKMTNKSKKKHVSVVPGNTKDVNEAPVSGNSQDNSDAAGTGQTGDTPPTKNKQEWTTVESKRKRKRRSTGEHSLLSVDDKLDFIMTQLKPLPAIEKKVNHLDQKLSRTVDDVAEIKGDIHEFDLKIKSLEYRAIDQEARSRRNNLIFWGIPEAISADENCETVVKEFLKTNLQVNTESFIIQRAHRNGRFSRGKTRSIIVNFLDYKTTELIMTKVNVLKGTGKGVSRDFPAEIMAARKRLYPKLKELKATHGKDASLHYPAKLVVKGTTVEDEFPNWFHFLHKRYNTQGGLERSGSDVSPRALSIDPSLDRTMDTSQGARSKTRSAELNADQNQGLILQDVNGAATIVNPNRSKRTVDSNGLPIFSSESESDADDY